MFFKVIIQLAFLLFMFHGNVSAIKFKFFGGGYKKVQLSQEELDSRLIDAIIDLQDITRSMKKTGDNEQRMLIVCLSNLIMKLLKKGADPYAKTPDDTDAKTVLLVIGTKPLRDYLKKL